jgi:hypothetical protein
MLYQQSHSSSAARTGELHNSMIVQQRIHAAAAAGLDGARMVLVEA